MSPTLGGKILTTRQQGMSPGNVFQKVLEECHSKGCKAQQFRQFPSVWEGNQNEAEDSPSSYNLRTKIKLVNVVKALSKMLLRASVLSDRSINKSGKNSHYYFQGQHLEGHRIGKEGNRF